MERKRGGTIGADTSTGGESGGASPVPRPREGRSGRRRTVVVLMAALVVLSAVSLTAFLVIQLTAPGERGLPLLNEVLFVPALGDVAFVELKNIRGGTESLADLSLTNEAGQVYRFPSSPSGFRGNSFLLVLFDGGGSVDGQIVHADRTSFLNPVAGSLLLRERADAIDKVAWGENQSESVKLTKGGVVGILEPGTTIGRYPSSEGIARRVDWTIYPPSQATPGGPNLPPDVEAMLPGDGASFDAANVTNGINLAWYGVPGADFYRVQVAVDDS